MTSLLQMTGSTLNIYVPPVASSALQMTGSQFSAAGPAIWPGRYRYIAASNTWRRHVRYRYNLATSSWVAYEYGSPPPASLTYMSIPAGSAGNKVATATRSLSIAAAAAGTVSTAPPMPVGNLTSFTQVVAEDFNINALSGEFLTKYPNMATYDGFQNGYSTSTYQTSNASVSGSTLDMVCQYDSVLGKATTATVLPNKYVSFLYGRVECYVWVDQVSYPNGGAAGYKTAFLLWPSSNTWSDGEIDFYEGGFTAAKVEFHDHGVSPTNPASDLGTVTSVSQLVPHRIAVEWTPGRIEHFVDGVSTFVTTNPAYIPTKPEVVRLQVEGGTAAVSPLSSAHVKVGWYVQYNYTP